MSANLIYLHKNCFSYGRKCMTLLHRKVSTDTSKAKINVEFSNGKSLSLSGGKYARLSDGAALGQIGNTSVLVATVSKEKQGHSNFLPLVVDYRQKAAAAGRIPTNFLRRELGPSEHEILTSRLIDRSIRPLFPAGFTNDTHVMCNLLAVDGIHDPDVVSINAASAALTLSDIPWNGPIGAVRVGMLGDNLIVNPTRRELANSSINLIVVAASQNLLVMLEGGAENILQQDFAKAIKFGVRECQNVVQALIELREYGKPKREFKPPDPPDESVVNFIKLLSEEKLKSVFLDATLDKLSRDNAVKAIRVAVLEKVVSGVPATTPDVENYCSKIFDSVSKDIFRSLIFETNQRCDGRQLNELRNISGEVDLHQPLHGSALFQRGQTQVLCTVALDSEESAMKLDPVSMLTSGLKEKNFFLHYEFPPYATNDLKGGHTLRREVGHGALAERALRPVVPQNFPFTIRLTSEVLESNGSSSMASVCGGSLALMDAGVPISEPAAGVAIGLVTEFENNDTKHIKDYRILTDILGIEDYMGDMDFKLAGTKKGITAVQADIKIPGLPLKVVMESIYAACDAKAQILEIMSTVLSSNRVEKKSNWPVCEKLEIPVHKRAKFMGPGGVNLKRLMLETGAQVSAREDSVYSIFAPNQDAMDEAKEVIQQILTEPSEPTLEFGGIYKAKIVELREIGVMVTLYESMVPTLLHNSQLDQRKVNHPSVLGLKVGDEIQVKYFGRDPVSGIVRLSRKILQGPVSGIVHSLK